MYFKNKIRLKIETKKHQMRNKSFKKDIDKIKIELNCYHLQVCCAFICE